MEDSVENPNGKIKNNHETDPYLKIRDVLGVDIKEQSKVNLSNLTAEIGELSADEQIALQTISQMQFVLQHRTTDFENVRRTGVLKSADQLNKSGENNDSHTLKEDYKRWGNTDFVFFNLRPRDMQDVAVVREGYYTALQFDPDVLFREGWISLDDWHSFRTGSSMMSYFGKTARYVTYDETKKTYNYNHADRTSTAITKTPIEEVYYNGDIRQALAMLFVRESRLLGKAYQEEAFKNKETITTNFGKLFDIEAKIPKEVSLNLLIDNNFKK